MSDVFCFLMNVFYRSIHPPISNTVCGSKPTSCGLILSYTWTATYGWTSLSVINIPTLLSPPWGRCSWTESPWGKRKARPRCRSVLPLRCRTAPLMWRRFPVWQLPPGWSERSSPGWWGWGNAAEEGGAPGRTESATKTECLRVF